MSGEYDWVAFNGAITMEHVTAADLEAQGVAMTWLPDDTSLWITGHHVPVANLWCVDPEIGSAASGLSLNAQAHDACDCREACRGYSVTTAADYNRCTSHICVDTEVI